MNPSTRTVIATVLLALLVAFAGCASPPEDSGGGDAPAAESPTTADNDAGAEPVAPPNETNGTESGGTVNPADENATGGDQAANESGEDDPATEAANESGFEEGGNDSDAGDGSNESALVASSVASVGAALTG